MTRYGSHLQDDRVTEDFKADSRSALSGKPHNSKLLLSSGEFHRDRCAEAGVAGPGAIVRAMAVGLISRRRHPAERPLISSKDDRSQSSASVHLPDPEP